MDAISIVLGILKIIPILDQWFQSLSAAYIQERLDSMKSENVAAIRKALDDKDQRDLEAAVGNPNPGLPSGDAGSQIIDMPPPGINS